VVETGSDGSYVEHWRRTSRPTDPMAAVSLRHGDVHAVLVRIGDHVGWAQSAAPTEVTMGRLTAHGILVGRSSRAGRPDLQLAWDADRLVVDGRRWSVVDLEGSPDDLVSTR